jgi:hypothetical protein
VSRANPVVLIGYPTGLEGILARAGSGVTRRVAENAQGVTQIVSQLAAEHLVRPTTTQGHIGDVLKDKIVYDAATTSGGSGGPLFNRNGKVIGVNFAILSDFGGSNLAVSVLRRSACEVGIPLVWEGNVSLAPRAPADRLRERSFLARHPVLPRKPAAALGCWPDYVETQGSR